MVRFGATGARLSFDSATRRGGGRGVGFETPVDEIGLFPLGIVLLPGERVPLHIFELRYRELIGQCLLTGAEFGLVPTGEKGMRPVGTRAAVVEVPRRYPDGRLDVVIEGRERFQVVERTYGRAFLTARVEPFLDQQDQARPEQLERCLVALRALLAETGTEAPELGEPATAFAIAAAVELGVPARLALLVSRSEGERLDLLSAELQRAASIARWRRTVGERAAGNGQVDSGGHVESGEPGE
jgi:Lon protease-like protein